MINDIIVDVNENQIYFSKYNVFGKFALMNYNIESDNIKTIIGYDKNPISRQIYYGEDKVILELEDDIFIYDIKTKEYQKIFEQDGYSSGFGDISHDNCLVAFTSRRYDSHPNIFITNLEKKETIKLTDELYGNRFSYWSYSDRYIAYFKQKLSDINKNRYIGIYCMQTSTEIILTKAPNSDCYINRQCWNKNTDELIYVEITPNISSVIIYTLEGKIYRNVLDEKGILEASFIDDDNILLIYHDNAQIYSLRKNRKTNVALEQDETIMGSFNGVKIRIINSNIYILSSKEKVYKTDVSGEVSLIIDYQIEDIPKLKKETHYFKMSDGVEIPVYENIPRGANGMTCLLVIGGPGEYADRDDFVVNGLLDKGLTVWVLAYRGCAEVPYKFGEMGKRDVMDIIEVGNILKNNLGSMIPVIGYSYGGLLTFLALSNSKAVFRCGVTLWGVTTSEKLPLHYKNFINNEMDSDERLIAFTERNAVSNSNNIKAPMLICHGIKDTTSTVEEVKHIQNSIILNNKDCDLILYENDGHGLPNSTDDYLQRICQFIKDN